MARNLKHHLRFFTWPPVRSNVKPVPSKTAMQSYSSFGAS